MRPSLMSRTNSAQAISYNRSFTVKTGSRLVLLLYNGEGGDAHLANKDTADGKFEDV